MMIDGNKRVRAGVAAALALGVFLLGSNSFAADEPAPAAPADGAPAAAAPADPNAPAATEEAKPAEPQEEKDYDEGVAGPLRFGPLVSLGFIRPIGIGLTAKYKRYLGFGVDYSFVPSGMIPLGDSDFSSWSLKGYGRFHPFKGAFYLTLGIGYQTTSATLNSAGSSITGDISSPMITAGLGWFWTWKFGLGFGLELGATIPFGSSATVSATGTAAAADLTKVADTLDLIGKTPLPQIELIKLGFLF